MYEDDSIMNIEDINSDSNEIEQDNRSVVEKTKVGLISMGQVLRNDLTEDIEDILEPDFELVCVGILDDYSYEQIRDKFWPKDDESYIVSSIADGKTVMISHSKAQKLINEKLENFERFDIRVKMLMCTGEFDDFNYSGILVQPSKIIMAILNSLDVQRIGIIVPEEDQIMDSYQQYSNFKPQIFAASPYESTDNIIATSYKFDDDVQIILLDCMGYTNRMKNLVKKATGKNVILPRTLISGVLYSIS